MTSSHKTMKLVGYESLTGEATGICAGLYTVPGKTNEIFIPQPTIEGDGLSKVRAFSPVLPRNAQWLRASDNEFSLSVGDIWKDVMLIDGKLCFGTRQEIHGRLGDGFQKIVRDFPMTAIDLTRDISGRDRKNAIAAAYWRIVSSLDAPTANSWVIDTYLRGQVLTHLRRKLTHINASKAALEALRYVEITKVDQDRAIRINLPGLREFDPGDIAPLLSLDHDREAYDLVSELPSPFNSFTLSGHLAPDRLVSHYRPKPVLLVSFGKTGDLYARSLLQNHGRSSPLLDPTWPGKLFEHITPAEIRSYDLRRFSVVIAIVEVESSKRARSDFENFKLLINRVPGLPLLIVPSLPPQGPSRLLLPREQTSIFNDDVRHMTLDTSSVRSPHYQGDRAVPLGRRIVDLVLQACILLLTKQDTLARFVRAMDDIPDGCLSVTFLGKETEKTRDFSPPTEAVAEGRGELPYIAERAVIMGEEGLSRRKQTTPSGIYELSIRPLRSGRIDDLAFAAIDDALGGFRRRDIDVRIEAADLPGDCDLEFNRLTAMATLQLDGPLKVLITVETPSIRTLLVMEELGVQVIRYSDKITLRQLFETIGNSPWKRVIPDDFRVLRAPRHSSKEVFGRASERIGLIVKYEDWITWNSRHPDNMLSNGAKIVVPSFSTPQAKTEIHTVVAISERDVSIARAENGEATDELLRTALSRSHVGIDRINVDSRRYHSDIDRWAFRVGRLPIVPRRLPSEYTIGEGWITFVGDKHAAAMLMTRVFEIWVRAHDTANHFPYVRRWNETALNDFPWPSDFSVLNDSTVVYDKPNDLFADLASIAEHQTIIPGFRDSPTSVLRNEIPSDYRAELTRVALEMYGLTELDSEVRVLERLLRYESGNIHTALDRRQ